MNLTNTQQTILEAAATRPDGAIYPMPERIKGGAALKVIKALANKSLIQDAGDNDWRIAGEGFKAIGQEPPNQNDDFEADVAAAEEALQIETPDEVEAPTELEGILALARAPEYGIESELFAQAFNSSLERAYRRGWEAATKEASKPRTTRTNSKQARMIEMMKRPEGATIEQIAQETEWSHNTIRGAISGGLKKRLGLNIATERAHYVGPNAKGGYTTYKIIGE